MTSRLKPGRQSCPPSTQWPALMTTGKELNESWIAQLEQLDGQLILGALVVNGDDSRKKEEFVSRRGSR